MTEKAKRLLEFSKEEIVEALSRWDFRNDIVNRILYDLDRKRVDELYKKAQQTNEAELEAMKKYNAWRQKIVNKYGEKVSLTKISEEEFAEGLALETDWGNKRKEHALAQKRFEKFYNRKTEE